MRCLFERTAPWVAITEPHRQQCDAALNRSINNSAKEDRNQPGYLDSTPHHQRTTSMDNRHHNSHSYRRRTLTLDGDVPFCHLFFVEPAKTHRRTTANTRCQNSQ